MEHEDLKAVVRPRPGPAPATPQSSAPGVVKKAAQPQRQGGAPPSPAAKTPSQAGSPGQKQPPQRQRKVETPTIVGPPPAESESGSGVDLYRIAKPLIDQKVKDARHLDRVLHTIETQISRGAPVNHWSGPASPLAGAVASRNVDFVEILLEAKADVEDIDEKGVSPLHTAAFDGMDLICKALLGARANVNAADHYKQTPIFFAPTRAVCETLFRAYADVNAMNTMGQSPLHLAAKA